MNLSHFSASLGKDRLERPNMNMNSIINMVLRRVIGKLINRGVDAGIDLAAKRGRNDDHPATQDMTEEERARANQAKQLAKKARQGARITRKLF